MLPRPAPASCPVFSGRRQVGAAMMPLSGPPVKNNKAVARYTWTASILANDKSHGHCCMSHLHAGLQLLRSLLRFHGLLVGASRGAFGLRRTDLRGGGRLALRSSL